MKEINRFKRIAGSLENLISTIAQDWDGCADSAGDVAGDASLDQKADKEAKLAPGGVAAKGRSKSPSEALDNPIYFQKRKAQLLFSELHSTARKTHGAIECFRYT